MKRLTCLLLLAAAALGCRSRITRDDALAGLVTGVVLPSYARLETTSAALVQAARSLEAVPDARAVHAVREAWRATLLALAHSYAFRSGPIQERGLHLTGAYWPVHPASIEALVGTPAPTAQAVASAGAASKGLHAIAYLLAGDTAPAPRRTLIRLLAEAFQHDAREVKRLAETQDLAGSLSRRGPEAFARVVSDLVETAETVVNGRLDHAMKERGNSHLEGEQSGASLAVTQALMAGVSDHYLGPAGRPGLSALVKDLAPAADQSLRRMLANANQALLSLDAPLETLAVSRPGRLFAARAACHAAEVELKTTLTSVLGVSILFRSVDGD